jgi:hypothetical protein
MNSNHCDVRMLSERHWKQPKEQQCSICHSWLFKNDEVFKCLECSKIFCLRCNNIQRNCIYHPIVIFDTIKANWK